MSRSAACLFVSLLLSSAPVLAAPATPSAARSLTSITPAAGDRIVFIGDSITYQCLWTQYVENYFYTRLPGVRVHIHNVGVGGDRTDTVLARFDKTVATIEPPPKYAFVMLGMNDARYQGFNAEFYARYRQGMAKLIERLDAMGTKVVAVSPPYFDWRFSGSRPPIDYNGVLSLYSNWLREFAADRGHGYVDINGPMARIVHAQRRTDPKFNFSPDGVHPRAPGQFVMALEILEQMGMPQIVSAIDLAHNGSQWQAEAENGEITNVAASDGDLTFTFHAKALPWVPPGTHYVDGEASVGYHLARASHRLNRESLRIRGLTSAGRYELLIDGEPVGQYDRDELATGIELQDNSKTPQYRQAANVVAANAERNKHHIAQYVKAWLMHAYHEKDRLYITDPANADQPDFEQRKADYNAWYDVNEKHKWKHHKLALEGEVEIYTLNQPKPHRYELRPLAE